MMLSIEGGRPLTKIFLKVQKPILENFPDRLIIKIKNGWSLMQVLKEEIRIEIENAAKKLFLENGFEKASMQRIAKKSGISKSNLYNYFKGKEEIFYHLTSDAYDKMRSIVNSILNHESYEGSDIKDFDIKKYIAFVSDEIQRLIMEFREEILLVMDCSAGTKYENTKEDLIAMLSKHLKEELIAYNNFVLDEDDFISHFIATSVVEGLLEIIRHKKRDAWIEKNIRRLMEYFVMGYVNLLDYKQ